FFQAEDGIRDKLVTGVQTCALPIFALLDALAERGTRTAIVSSSANAPDVLRAAGVLDRFEAVVDGTVARRQDLAGKPRPDTYERSEERRVGKECTTRRGRAHDK